MKGIASSQMDHLLMLLILLLLGTLFYHTESASPSQHLSITGWRTKLIRVRSSRSPPSPHYYRYKSPPPPHMSQASPPPPKPQILHASPPPMSHRPSLSSQMQRAPPPPVL